MGNVSVQNATEIINLAQFKEIDLVTGNNKRNPFRKIEIDSYRVEEFEESVGS